MTRPMLRIFAVLGFLGLAAALLWTAALSFEAAQQRSREYRYLSDALDPVEPASNAVAWTEPRKTLVRDVTAADKTQIGTALTESWRTFAAASDTGETAVLADHFAGIALSRAEIAAREAWRDRTRMVVLEQKAEPEFLHLDGSVFQLSAKATTVRYALREGALVHYELVQDDVRTTLTNETTGWRIYSHERTGSRALAPVARPVRDLPRLTGVNYYPAKTLWRRFWPEFDPIVVAADLSRVSDMGGSAVRIFLPVADFGPDADGEVNLRNLEVLLAMAQARDIRVIPTLFDLKPGYRPAVWADDAAYLRRVLPVLSASSAVALVDLKNEPDLDRTAEGAGLIDAWLTTMALMAHDIAPDLALTIGWSSAEFATDLVELVDAVSYHDYADITATADRLAAVRAQAMGKPVLVTEIGASSYSLVPGFPGSEDAQARALEDRLAQLQDADGVLIWTLYDFANPDAVAVGASPWVRRLQSRFGLFDAHGSIKPAGKVAAAAFMATPSLP